MEDTVQEQAALKLSNETLHQLPGQIRRPAYDRSKLTPGIVHIGLGNFHRAHQAWYLHRLMQLGEAQDWAIIGAGVRPYDAVMREKLVSQDCLTSLIELDPAGSSAEVIGPMIDYLPVEEGNASLVRTMSNPAIRIVSLTITEGGYFLDPATGKLDAHHPDIRHDVDNPSSPRTVFAAIIAALSHRRDAGQAPFTIQSCDNLQGNGQITREVIVTMARMSDPNLAGWIDKTAAFPNSMVDCIVPATGPDEVAIAMELGINDAAPVTHEKYRQWIIEDDFCAGRPDWEKVGAVLTDSVHAYETMKIRVLNAGHQVLANAGELLSIATIAECMRDSTLSAFFRRVQEDEILPYVSPAPNTDPTDYLSLIETRFSNPLIKDTTRRVAFDGSSRHTGFVLPILRDAAAANGQIDGLCLVEAMWARMCAGTREDGSPIEANDPKWAALNQAASLARQSPDMWLNQIEIYGELANDKRIRDRFSHWLKVVWDNGSRAAIDQYLAGV